MELIDVFDEAKRLKIEFNEDIDETDDKVRVCDHLFESAGESVFALFNIDSFCVGESIFNKKRSEVLRELLICKDEFSRSRKK